MCTECVGKCVSGCSFLCSPISGCGVLHTHTWPVVRPARLSPLNLFNGNSIMTCRSAEHGEGGPTKEELLDLIQSCDVSASRASSVVSSRTPSPSPSLMSIMYPGLRQPPGRHSLPGTPCSIGRLIGSGGGANALGNLFQPIRSSQSSNSLNSSSAVNPVSLQPPLTVFSVEEEEEVVPSTQVPQGEEGMEHQEQRAGDKNEQSPSELDSQEEATAAVNEAASVSEDAPALKASTNSSSSIHQRSRSNEIDYTSVGSTSRGLSKRPKSVSAFQSPPGTVRGLPPSADSAHGSLFPESLASSTLSSSHPDSALAGDTETKARETQKRQVSGNSPPYWSREFDIALSDYFSSNEEHLQVTDC